MLPGALGLLLGICVPVFAAALLPLTSGIALLLAACSLSIAALRMPARASRGVLLVAASFLLGVSYANHVAGLRMQQRLAASVPVQDLPITGEIVGLPEPSPEATRFTLRVLHSPVALTRVRISWYGAPALKPGERWQLRLRLRRPHGEVNPGGFDFERYAAQQQIAAVGYVLAHSENRKLGNAHGVDALRERLSAQIAELLPPGRVSALLRALSVGDTRALTDADWELLRATGITHLIAISGLHVTLLATFGAGAGWLLSWAFPQMNRHLPRPQLCAGMGLLCATGYAALAGFGVPALRTLLMLSAVLLGVLLRRVQTLWQGYALALVSVLLWDPLVVLSAGAWLSFAAVAWLIVLYGQRWPRLGFVRELVGAQVLMSVALLPLTLVFFQQASLSAPFANLLAVPVVSLLIVPLVLAATVLLLTLPALAPPLLALAAGVFSVLLGALDWFAAGQYASVQFAAPSALAVLLAVLGAAWLFAPRGVPWRYAGALLLLPLVLPKAADQLAEGSFELLVFDVGQGLSALVRTRDHTLLYDTGPSYREGANAGDNIVVPSLRELGVASLDRVVVSHADADHAGGLTAVRRAFPNAPIITSADAQIQPSTACQSGQSWLWNGVKFRMLHPNPGLPYRANQSSCVLKVQAGNGSALLTGDIDSIIEERLLRLQSAHLPAELLLAAHHGSNGSNSAAFLEAVAPKWVIYPVGHQNRYGFPRLQVQERVAKLNALQVLTSQTGALRFRFSARTQRWEYEPWRARSQHWWREF